jgi:hypothetical protein
MGTKPKICKRKKNRKVNGILKSIPNHINMCSALCYISSLSLYSYITASTVCIWYPEQLLMSFNFRHNFISFSDFGPSQLSYIDAQLLMHGTKSQVNAYFNCYFTKVLTFYYDLLGHRTNIERQFSITKKVLNWSSWRNH